MLASQLVNFDSPTLPSGCLIIGIIDNIVCYSSIGPKDLGALVSKLLHGLRGCYEFAVSPAN